MLMWGIYSIAIIETDDEAVVENIHKNDPAIKAQVGFRSEYYSMYDLHLPAQFYLDTNSPVIFLVLTWQVVNTIL
jgi:hypothetical protein